MSDMDPGDVIRDFGLNDVDEVGHLLRASAFGDASNPILDRLSPAESTKNLGPPDSTRFCQHERSCLISALRGYFKGFVVAYSIKGGFSLLFQTLSGRAFRHPLSSLEAAFGRDSLQFSAFFSGLTGTFRAVLCLLRRLRDKEDPWNTAVAGGVAGLALALDGNRGRRHTVGLFMIVRAAAFLAASLTRRGILRPVPHADLGIFVIASAQVMYAWHLYPQTLPNAYHRWIDSKGDIDPRWRAVVSAIATRQPFAVKGVHAWCDEQKLPKWPALPAATDAVASLAGRQQHMHGPGCVTARQLPCSVAHPTMSSCTLHAVYRLIAGLKGTIPVYLPVHILPAVLFRFRQLREDPAGSLAHIVRAIAASSAFLSAFQAIFWLVWCQTRTFQGRDTKLATLLASTAAGFSVLLEKKGRRMELALFVLPRAIDSLWKIIQLRSGFAGFRWFPVALFSLSMSIIFTIYQWDAESIRPAYLRLMTRYLKKN